MAEDGIEVTNNQAAQRFEVQLDSALALLQYERTGDRITYLHTEVPDALEGRGIGSRLAQTALEDARAQHQTVVPLCPFVRSYIERHPEYLPLVDAAHRRRMGEG